MRGLHGLSAFLGLAAACAVGPDHREPEPPLPPAFVEAGGESVPPGTDPWWLQLEDETLQQLIRDAVAGNFDLRIAAARVEEVRADRRIAAADRFPRVDAAASAERGRDSGHTEFPGATSTHNRFQLGLESGWELDFWGRVRRSVEAADADHAAAEALLADARRLVIAQVAAEYVELRGVQRELSVLRRNLEIQRASAELTGTLAAEGLGNEADVERARGLLKETEAAVPLLEARVAGGAHRLALLTGRDGASVKRDLMAEPALPDAPPPAEFGVPSDLLRARPDIRAAERDLAAATARIGVATADLFPRVSLTGRFGLDSNEADTLFDAGSFSFGVGPALRWPVLDFGRVRAGIRAQGARQAAALARYEQTVARAVTEVESSLAALRARRENRESLDAALAHTREALRLIEARFREGATSFLDVLDAQRRMLAVEADLARAQTALLQDYVTLNRALG